MAARRRYNERLLGPLVIQPEWWYSLPSVTRVRLRKDLEAAEALEHPGGRIAGHLLVGQVQDVLVDAGKRTAAARFMRAMQEAHDAQEASDRASTLAGLPT